MHAPLAILLPRLDLPSETFLRRYVEGLLPGGSIAVLGDQVATSPAASGGGVLFARMGAPVGLVGRVRRFAAQKLRYRDYDHADGVITVSEVRRQRLVDIGIAAERVHVVPCGAAGWERATQRFSWDRERRDLLRLLDLSHVA